MKSRNMCIQQLVKIGCMLAVSCFMVVSGCQETISSENKVPVAKRPVPSKEACELVAALASSDENAQNNAGMKILSGEVHFGASEVALLPQMVNLLKSEDTNIQLAVLALLGTMGQDAAEALPAIKGCLNSYDKLVRIAAEDIVEEIEHPQVRPRLDKPIVPAAGGTEDTYVPTNSPQSSATMPSDFREEVVIADFPFGLGRSLSDLAKQGKYEADETSARLYNQKMKVDKKEIPIFAGADYFLNNGRVEEVFLTILAKRTDAIEKNRDSRAEPSDMVDLANYIVANSTVIEERDTKRKNIRVLKLQVKGLKEPLELSVTYF